ncbi:MAG: ATP-binding protein, partial [Saprospiraceae bacterium]
SYRFLGDFPQSLEMQFTALQINQRNHDKNGEAVTLGFIGFTYVEFNEFQQGLYYLNQAQELFIHLADSIRHTLCISNIGSAYERMDKLDSALLFQQQARENSIRLPHGNLKILILTRLGIVSARLDKKVQALQYYREALQDAYDINDKVNPGNIQIKMAEVFNSMNERDSSLHYARLSYLNGSSIARKLQVMDASNLLVKLYRNNAPDSVIYYQDIAIAMQDSLYGPHKLKQLQLLMLDQLQKQQKTQQEQQAYKNKIRTIALLTLLGFFLTIAIILFRNNQHKQKTNSILQDQKDEIQKNLVLLKSAQGQLIQREKMAALGELTAGISHEIQNPLNFVNNFSELSKELMEEVLGERKKENGKRDESLEGEILGEIKENLSKIHHHGQRASSIVKGMLEHSRTNTGKKELTDINVLVEEYLRLSYHGLRAKDKDFHAEMVIDFDPNLPKTEVIPQDIGRVFLNLINNGFQAVDEQSNKGIAGFKPILTVSTKSENSQIVISIKDNGPGIPESINDKIFQPFFTTKPTGQGTGLGLSLAYDIVTKGHGGALEFISTVGIGAEFIITLPLKS